MVQEEARAVLTFAFDDGYAETVASTAERLSERGWRGTYSVITDRVGRSFCGLPLASWVLLRDATSLEHEVASHGADHRPMAGVGSDVRRWIRGVLAPGGGLCYARRSLRMAVAALRGAPAPTADREGPSTALADTRARIAHHLPGARVPSFVYPAGRCNRASRQAVRRAGFLSARGLNLGLNHPPLRRFHLRAVSVWPDMGLDELAGWLDRAVQQSAWLVLVFHLVAPANPTGYPYFYPVADFQHLLDAVQARAIRVATQTETVNLLSPTPLTSPLPYV